MKLGKEKNTSESYSMINRHPLALTSLVLSFFAGLFVSGCAIWTYFNEFGGDYGDQEKFAQFGDYIGGVINPIMGFLTVCLLIFSIYLQRLELSEVRKSFGLQIKEFESATDVHRKNVFLAARKDYRENLVLHYNLELASYESFLAEEDVNFYNYNNKPKGADLKLSIAKLGASYYGLEKESIWLGYYGDKIADRVARHINSIVDVIVSLIDVSDSEIFISKYVNEFDGYYNALLRAGFFDACASFLAGGSTLKKTVNDPLVLRKSTESKDRILKVIEQRKESSVPFYNIGDKFGSSGDYGDIF